VAVGVVVGRHVRAERRRERADAVRRAEAVAAGADRPPTQYPLIDEILCVGCGGCVDACPEGDVLGIIGGRAAIVNGMQCVGHGKCAEACPVGAIRVGIGDAAERPDIPVLDDDHQTTVPGIYVAGELSGFSLIRNAIAQGSAVIEAISRAGSASPALAGRVAGRDDAYDVVIVGAGPAGLSAALAARERSLSHVVLDQQGIGGTILQYPRRKIVLTQPVDIPLHGRLERHEYSKEQLLEIWTGIIDRFDVPVRLGARVTGVERDGDAFRVESTAGHVRGRNVILALGRRGTPRRLGVPGEDLPKVAYQLIDAESYRDEHVLIVGGGDSAVEAAIALARGGRNVVSISYRRPDFVRIKKRNAERLGPMIDEGAITPYFGSTVERIEPDRVLLAIGGETRALPNTYTFVMAGGEPPFGLLRSIGVGFGGEQPAPDRRAAAG